MGAPHYTVALQKIAAEQGLTVLHAAQDYATREIRTADVNRPGLQLAGFYNYFDPERMQIIGRVESTYLETLTPDQRRERFEQFMRYNIIGLVICHGMDPFPECLEMAEKYDRNLFLVRKDTSEFMADLIASLSSYLAPRLTQHGVLVEVFGEGVLITGDSGVGKSETALELIKRGHRLVADDAVEIKRINRTTLMGSAPEMIRYYMELRGIGVIDARQIYGVGAVKPETRVDLVVQLEPWEDGRAYDRLGLTTEYCEILNVRVPCVTIPVGPGRNLAVILELAAMNNRQKKMGYNAAAEFTEQINKHRPRHRVLTRKGTGSYDESRPHRPRAARAAAGAGAFGIRTDARALLVSHRRAGARARAPRVRGGDGGRLPHRERRRRAAAPHRQRHEPADHRRQC